MTRNAYVVSGQSYLRCVQDLANRNWANGVLIPRIFAETSSNWSTRKRHSACSTRRRTPLTNEVKCKTTALIIHRSTNKTPHPTNMYTGTDLRARAQSNITVPPSDRTFQLSKTRNNSDSRRAFKHASKIKL